MADQTDHDMEQLDSADPDVRRAAIAALRESGKAQAVAPLLKMAHTDPVEALRNLAREAAYAIGESALSPADTDQPPLTPASVIRPIAPPPRRVTGHEKRFARRRLNQALNFQIAGNKEQASSALAEALRADPDMVHNPSLRGLATTVTDLPTEQAVAYLIQRSKDPFITLEDDLKPVFTITPDMARLARDIGLLFIILLPLSLVLVNWSNLLSANTQGHVNLLQTSFPLNSPGSAALALIRASLILLAGILFANIVTFFIGQFLGGVGLLYAYLKTMVRLQIGIALVVIGLVVLNAMTILSIPAENWQGVTLTVLTLSILGTIAGSIVGHAYFIKRAHEFDFARGTLTAVVSALLLGALAVAVSGVFNR